MNNPLEKDEPYPDWMGRFALAGVRDWSIDVPHRWVPCASCMHPVFNENPKPDRKIVIYDHKEHPFVISTPTMEMPKDKEDNEYLVDALNAPRAHNTGFGSMAEAVRFIARGEIVLTTSYHGAYWGMLLGRGVIVQDNGLNRFHRMWHPFGWWSTIVREVPWYRYAHIAHSHYCRTEALQTCRQANLAFRDTVSMLVRSAP